MKWIIFLITRDRVREILDVKDMHEKWLDYKNTIAIPTSIWWNSRFFFSHLSPYHYSRKNASFAQNNVETNFSAFSYHLSWWPHDSSWKKALVQKWMALVSFMVIQPRPWHWGWWWFGDVTKVKLIVTFITLRYYYIEPQHWSKKMRKKCDESDVEQAAKNR